MFWANYRIVSYFCVLSRLFPIFVFWVDYFIFLYFRFMYIHSFLINKKVKVIVSQ